MREAQATAEENARGERSGLYFWAFIALTAFVVQMYSVPGEWIPQLAPLRFALLFSSVGAALFLLQSVGSMAPIALDGVRGHALLAFAAVAAASQRWSVEPEVTRAWMVDLLKLVAVYFTLVNVVTTARRLTVICAAMVLASIVTSIGVIHWYHKGVDLVEGFRARWVGVYADPNHMAEAMVIILPLVAAFVAHKRMGLFFRGLCLAAGGLATVAIVESHSRGGFIGLTAGMVVWALRERQYRVRAVLTGLALAVGLAVFAPKSFWDRNDTLQNFHEDASAMGRVYAWRVSNAISLDRPLLGVGGGAFRFAWHVYAPFEAKKAYVAHNIYLDIIGELGWVGLFFFMIFSGGAAGGAFAASRDDGLGWLARGLAASMVGYLLCNCFSGQLLSAHLYVLFALAASAERIVKGEAREKDAPGDDGPKRLIPVPVRADER
jgi:O-antigen ligase